MTADDPDIAQVARFHPREDYPRSPMPSGKDRAITRAVVRLVDEAAVGAAVDRLAGQPENNLGAYAERMAALAVRERDLAHVRLGLRACVVVAATDFHDSVMTYSLLWRSVEKLGFDPHSEFVDLASSLGRHGESLRAFAARPPEARTIQCMGFVEDGAGATFRYRFNPRF